jgi:hypothetical protein
MMENKEANGNLNFVHFSVVHEGVSPYEERKEENEHNPAFLELHEETYNQTCLLTFPVDAP